MHRLVRRPSRHAQCKQHCRRKRKNIMRAMAKSRVINSFIYSFKAIARCAAAVADYPVSGCSCSKKVILSTLSARTQLQAPYQLLKSHSQHAVSAHSIAGAIRWGVPPAAVRRPDV